MHSKCESLEDLQKTTTTATVTSARAPAVRYRTVTTTSKPATTTTRTQIFCPGTGLLPMFDRNQQPMKCHLGEEWPCLHSQQHVCAYASINATEGICCARPHLHLYRYNNTHNNHSFL